MVTHSRRSTKYTAQKWMMNLTLINHLHFISPGIVSLNLLLTEPNNKIGGTKILNFSQMIDIVLE